MGIKLVLLGVLICATLQQQTETKFNYFPHPKEVEIGSDSSTQSIEPCTIQYKINVDLAQADHIKELVTHYQRKTFGCQTAPLLVFNGQDAHSVLKPNYTANVDIKDPKLRSVFTLEEEKYTLTMNENGATIGADTYVGFVRGMQTFTQSVLCNQTVSGLKCRLSNLPISVKDQPLYPHRGVMIDSARHFLPLHLILETIDALMYNKFNVLHWHITDEDSFPLVLDKHPEIAEFASFSQVERYTTAEAREVVRYAMVRGVRVIPQLDTPGHANSWGRAPQNKDVACPNPNGYMGALDVTMDSTYKLVKEVFEEINSIFVDPVVHLGGDEVMLGCRQNLSNINPTLQKDSITLEQYYRRRQRQIIKEINPNKRAMYWANSEGQTKVFDDRDIIHWWGGGFPTTTERQIVISNYGPYYLDFGVGNYLGMQYGMYNTWMGMYGQNLQQKASRATLKGKVIGAEVCLWSQMSNQHTHHIKIWIRSSGIAERTWHGGFANMKPGPLRRMTAFERILNRREIPSAPATCQQCQTNAQFC